MEWLSKTPSFDFMGRRRLAVTASCIAVAVSIIALIFRGLNFGIDFTGGLLLELSYGGPAELDEIRAVLAEEGFGAASVQNFGTSADVLIRLPPVEDEAGGAALGERVLAALAEQDSSVRLLRNEFVGPQVGEDLTEQGGLAMLIALILVFVYVMLRFRWKFAAGSIIALVHDVIVTVGFFAVLWLPFDLAVLAAVLAVIGYSLNDKIVVFDRIRENFRLMRRGTAESIINASINQTLARTLMTGVTTLLVLLGLLFLGGDTLFGFSVALIVGILVGTYSSIYVGSTAALALKVTPADLMPPKREEIDELP